MCGICGQFNFERAEPVSRATLEAMTASLAHRGPDDEGYHYARGLGLGFRRLSIIDLDGGHQPMSDADESIWVAFNGEIYNFPELRAELESHGHRFRTRSDTEVIVHGYKQWGTGILKRLNGMFGLAIWDEGEHRLVLARDRSGIKLVYFKVANGTVWFGSELRAVLAALRTAPQVDVTAVGLFLRYRYTPSPYTLHEGIRKLAPGSMAVFEQGAFRLERWHRPAESMQPPPDDDEAIDQLLEIYKRALSRHLLSDVPVGLLLSGGVDSGLLLGLMSLFGDRWPTFSIGYGTKLYKNDELAGAARTAALFSARHTMVQVSVGTFQRALPTIVSALEEPVAASSIVPMYYVCERARQDVKVALVGQGPDELFGGYKRHLGIRYGDHWRSMPSWIRSGVGAAINRLPRNETLQRGLYALDVTERAQRYRNALSIMPGDRISSLFRQEHRVEQAAEFACWENLERESNGMDELSGFQHLETGSTLPDELLMYADKLSMAHGLEVRVPYLDNEVVDFAQRLAPAQKIRLGRQKWIHRRVCERFLPPEILRRKKRGFAVDAVDGWLRGDVKSTLGETINDDSSLIYRFLEPASVQALLDEHRAGKRDNHKLLFSLVVLEQWLRGRESADSAAARRGRVVLQFVEA